MPILSGGNGIKLMCGGHKVAKIYCAGSVVYASGNVCTYHVDGSTYQEEVDEGASCLSPASFTVPEKAGYAFAGWSLQSGGDALADLIMADDPIELYAVWIGNPHQFTPLNSVTWTESRPNGNTGDYKKEISESKISVSAKKTGGNVAMQRLTASIPTGGCKKVDVSFESYYGNNGNNINGVTLNTYDFNGGTLTFNCSGDYITIYVQANDSTEYFTARAEIRGIYFHN